MPSPTPQPTRRPTCAELGNIHTGSDPLIEKYVHGLESNPDISGIGVLVGFFATAWISFFFMAFHCLVASREPVNLLDRLFYRGTERFLIKISSPHWAQIMETAVLAMSDQQLVTGLAILISGFSQLKQSLLYYHWQIIIDLAWFSSATHLSSLMCLEQYFQRHRLIWYARLFLMTGLVAMLEIAIMGTGTHGFQNYSRIDILMPAVCLFELSVSEVSLSTIIGAIMLLVGFVVRVMKMFSATRGLSRLFFHRTGRLWRRALAWPCKKLQASSRSVQAIFLPFIIINLALLVTAQCLQDFVRSHTFGILWLLVSLIWGTIRLLYIRHMVNTESFDKHHTFDENIFKEENTWTFGQVVPVLMLLTPILLLCEGFSEMVRRSHALPKFEIFSNYCCPPHSEPHQHLPPTLSGTDVNTNTSQAQPDHILITQLQMEVNDGFTKSANEPLCDRILTICKEEFRHRPWYQDNLLFAVASTVLATTYILPLAQSEYADSAIGLFFFAFPIVFVFMVIIPLCGIQDMIDQVQLTQRHPLSLVRLAIDPGKLYFISRYVFFLYFSISLIPFNVRLLRGAGLDIVHAIYGLPPLVVAVSISFFGLCGALIMGAVSIYKQLFSLKPFKEVSSFSPGLTSHEYRGPESGVFINCV